MSEAGGTSTHSGIYYQNSIAALFLGRLLGTSETTQNNNVVYLRLEAFTHVDDIVVRYADNHTEYIQVKETLTWNSDPWKKMWKSFAEQFCQSYFQKGTDKIVLTLGNEIIGNQVTYQDIQALANRSLSGPYHEWEVRISKKQQEVLENVRSIVAHKVFTDESLHYLFQHVEVRFMPTYLVENQIDFCMPAGSNNARTIFDLLVALAAKRSSIRAEYTGPKLREEILNSHPNLQFQAPHSIQELEQELYRANAPFSALRNTFGQTNIHIERPEIKEISTWITLHSKYKNVAVLIDQAGMGKSVLMRDLLHNLKGNGYYALAIKAERAISGSSSIDDIRASLGLRCDIFNFIGSLAKIKSTVVILDQIDALSLSQAHDQKSLDLALDLIANISLIPDVHLIISCRTFDWHTEPRFQQLKIDQRFQLQPLVEEDVKHVVASLKISYESLSRSAKELLRTPLHLDLFTQIAFGAEPSNLTGIKSLQELYHIFWDRMILAVKQNAPSTARRLQFLQSFVGYMDANQVISVPLTAIDQSSGDLSAEITWFIHMGVISQDNTKLSFFHQTFFDYCYSRFFVESKRDLSSEILKSDQGLVWRSRAIQILSFLRGLEFETYIISLSAFLYPQNDQAKIVNKLIAFFWKSRPQLRPHLQNVVLKWLGSLQDPTEKECVSMLSLVNSGHLDRRTLIHLIWGNSAWFLLLKKSILLDWLKEELHDPNSISWRYLYSVIDKAQIEVIELIRPFWRANENSDMLIVNLLTVVRKWQSDDALVLLTEAFERDIVTPPLLYLLPNLAETHPRISIRILSILFKRNKEKHADHFQNSEESAYSLFHSEWRDLDDHHITQSLKSASEKEPIFFLESFLMIFLSYFDSTSDTEGEAEFFHWDYLSTSWYEHHSDVRKTFVHSIIKALCAIAAIDDTRFNSYLQSLINSANLTPQQVVAAVFSLVEPCQATEAYQFLLADKRRLHLGEDSFETRRLIRRISNELSDFQIFDLEQFILSSEKLKAPRGIDGLKSYGFDRLRLLSAIPTYRLSRDGRLRLGELQRKFPAYKDEIKPRLMEGGIVSSPIDEERAEKMSSQQWLKAIRKYHQNQTHRHFLRGGAHELAQQLGRLIKKNPEKYEALIQNLPEDTDDAYISSIVRNLSESSLKIDLMLGVIRRFGRSPERNIRRSIGWALQKRAQENLPDDMILLLEEYLNGRPGEDEFWWSKGENHGNPFNSFLNSDRGAAFGALIDFFQRRADQVSIEKAWKLLGFVTTEDSTAMRIGAIQALPYMLNFDRERAIDIFESLIQGHDILYESYLTRNFLYYGFYRNYLRLRKYIHNMMNYQNTETQKSGAELAVIASLSTAAMESNFAKRSAIKLARHVFQGPISWKTGAIHVYAENLADPFCEAACVKNLGRFLKSQPYLIGKECHRIFSRLEERHFVSLRGFLSEFAKSRLNQDSDLAEFLWKHGESDPSYSINLQKRILRYAKYEPVSQGNTGADKCMRLVLKLYQSPKTSRKIKKQALDIFDRMLAVAPDYGNGVLREWDEL
ncbi:MAG: NACHT domain-containing protein [Spirochaetota bacterium]